MGLVGLAQTAVTPRVLEGGVLLFDNETGTAASKFSIIFDGDVTLVASDFTTIGGDQPTLVAGYKQFVFVDVVVVAGGTLQLALPADYVGAKVTGAFWFK